MDLRSVIKRRGLSLADLGKQMKGAKPGTHLSQPSVYSIVTGNPSFSKLEEISGILGIRVSEMIAEAEQDGGGSVSLPNAVCPHCGKPITVKLECQGA